MTIGERIGALAIACALVGASVSGCGHAPISRQLADARRVMAEARDGSAGELEPDELLTAQRTLTMAEGQEDGSAAEIHYAYVAERQARVAMADARRAIIEQGVAQDQRDYQEELELVARERGAELDVTRGELDDQQRVLEQQQARIAADAQALAIEQQARRQAEANSAAALERLRALANVRVEPTETVITLSGEVLFETNRSELRPEARERLTAVADAMRASPTQLAVVAGYTDSRGSDVHNQQLSQARADSVRAFLLSAGVPESRVRAEGRGESSPIASNDSAEGRANNRRVEIILRPAVAATTPSTTVTITSGH